MIVAVLFTALPGVGAESMLGFLIMSAPRNSKISYVKLPDNGDFSHLQPHTLIDTGLRHPQGIAVDQKRKWLYVADPDVLKIYAYRLKINGNTLATDGRQMVISRDAESRWVSVDGLGNVFFSDEPQNLIMRMPMKKIFRGDTTPEIVYNGHQISQVSKPGGVAVDNFHVYWTNKHIGTMAGSLVKGAENPEIDGSPKDTISVMAQNSAKSYGVCLALGNVFFTDADRSVYGVKKSGGEIAEVSGQLKHPRGCVWDGDGTVYVADRGANAVYSFAGNMHHLSHVQLSKAFDFEDAFGLAVIASAPRHWGSLHGAVVLVCALLLSIQAV